MDQGALFSCSRQADKKLADLEVPNRCRITGKLPIVKTCYEHVLCGETFGALERGNAYSRQRAFRNRRDARSRHLFVALRLELLDFGQDVLPVLGGDCVYEALSTTRGSDDGGPKKAG